MNQLLILQGCHLPIFRGNFGPASRTSLGFGHLEATFQVPVGKANGGKICQTAVSALSLRFFCRNSFICVYSRVLHVHRAHTCNTYMCRFCLQQNYISRAQLVILWLLVDESFASACNHDCAQVCRSQGDVRTGEFFASASMYFFFDNIRVNGFMQPLCTTFAPSERAWFAVGANPPRSPGKKNRSEPDKSQHPFVGQTSWNPAVTRCG